MNKQCTRPERSRRNKALAVRLRRLAQAIAGAPTAAKAARLSCDACEALLEFYMDAAERGEKVRARFPAVWKHLQTCARCQESYRLLSESFGCTQDVSLRAETPSIGDALPSAPPLPFLAPAPSDAAWSKRVRSRVGGAPLGFGFIIQALHLRRVVSASQPALLVRGKPAPSLRLRSGQAQRSLVLSDTLSLGDRDVAVQVWAQRLDDSDAIRLEGLIASSTPLPAPLRVTLRWDDYAYSNLVHQGRFSFDEIPVSSLEHIRDFHVEFDCGD